MLDVLVRNERAQTKVEGNCIVIHGIRRMKEKELIVNSCWIDVPTRNAAIDKIRAGNGPAETRGNCLVIG